MVQRISMVDFCGGSEVEARNKFMKDLNESTKGILSDAIYKLTLTAWQNGFYSHEKIICDGLRRGIIDLTHDNGDETYLIFNPPPDPK